MTTAAGWRRRGSVALLGVSVGLFILPVVESTDDVINSDWPAFATGARIITSQPSRLYDLNLQRSVEYDVTGGRTLITLGIEGILPFVTPPWVALLAVPFDALGTGLGGRLWTLVGLLCLAGGLALATRPRPPSTWLPAFASVPTALLVLNAQLDGLVALGLGAALALWSRPFLAGLALSLTLVKPQLVLPVGAALILTRRWKVIGGWAAGAAALAAIPTLLYPDWLRGWISVVGRPVISGSRDVDLAHFGTLVSGAWQPAAVVALSVVALTFVLALAPRARDRERNGAAVLIAGGVMVAPHALSTDLVLVGLALAVWGNARWFDWVLVSAGALICALAPLPVPPVVGVLLSAWICLRAGGALRGLEAATAGAAGG